ncbi:uncharacterized protein LOC121140287 [Mesocricetus auratus]|uniref:Uncharacterized protein LOC121140287 n=1 Tax=Mesocricetus auratus TaxID=10036 RepID=A0ABM2XDN6_MESAU|nr:uncharacterized protein LOC121140287 [Mesocricetus auratus]
MKNLVHGIKEKTPMGFCDVPRKNLFDFLHDMKSISVSNEPRYKPLIKIHQAASEGDAERLQRMISLGKHSVHDRDCKQRTALHYACAYGQVEVVNFLLKNNCDVDAIDMNSVTPLMKAVQNWTYECVCTLLKHGADPNHMDKDGNTSLHYAVSEGNQILAKCLLKYSADMEQKNKDGFTPLLQALKENKIEMAKFLVMNGANIHVFDYMKRNTLLYAIRWNSKDMVSLLLNEGIDVFFKDVFGWTALRYAIEGTSKGIREILTDYDEKLRVKHKNGNSESDLEIESLEETLSDENEDKQSLSADGDFSWTTEESGQKHKSRQNTGNLEEQAIELTLEEEQKKNNSSENSQCLSIFKLHQPKQIGSIFVTRDNHEENTINGEEKELSKEYPQKKSTTEEETVPNDSPDKKKAKSLQTDCSEESSQYEDFKLETESKDYSECSENTQSSNSIMCLQSKYVPHFSVGVNSRSTNHLIVGEKVFPRIDPEYKNNQSPIGSKAFVSSEVSTVKHEHEFLPEKDLQLKMENLKYLDGDENTQLSDIVTHIQLRCNPHLSTGLSPRPMSILNERGKGFCVIYRQRKPPIVKRGSVPTDPSPAVKCGQEFPSEEDSKMETDDFQELLDDNESIQSYNSAMCLQPGTSPYLSLGLTQKPMNLSNEGGKEVNMQMKADNNFKNVEEIGSTQSSGTMADLQQWHTPHLPVQPISTPRNLQNKGQKVYQIHKQSTEPGLQKKSVKNQDNLEINKNTQLSDNVMDLQPRKILHSSTALSPRFIDLNAGGETKLQMKSEENQKHNDGNENIQSSDSLTHPQPIQISHLLMGLIPRPVNIKSRPGKESQKKHPSLKDSTEIKVDTDATLERKEMQTIKPVILEDDQDKCDASQNNRPLVSGNSKGHTSNEKEDALHSCGCAAASAAPDVSEASVVAAIVAAVIVATPAAAATAASAAVAAVMAAVAPAVTAAASAAAAIDALAAVAPGAAPDISAVPVAAATAATAAAVPAAAAATPDTAPATVAAAAAAAAAATVAVASVAAASLTAASASVAAVVAATVTAAAGSEAPTVAPAAAAAVAAATSPAAAAALVASLAATAAPCSPPPVTMSPAAPSTVAAATAAAAALATHAAASPAVAAAAAAAVAISTIVPQGAPAVATAAAAAAAVAAADPPDACPDAHPAAPATVTKRLILQRKNVEARKQQPPFEEAEEHDRSKKKISKEKVEVLKPVKDTCDLNALTPINESCSEKYIGNSLKSTPVFDSHKELIELKEINVQILTEKTKVENELSEVKEENSQLKKKLVKKNEKIFKLRSMIKEQAEKKRNIICAYNEIVDELREKEEMMERRGEQYNRQVTETHELEVCLKTRDVELKQLQKEKEHAQKMDDHLQVLELENTSLIATVKKQKENIEHLQRHLQDTHKDVVQSSNLENKNLCKKHASVIHEMENTMRTLKSEVSSVKTSNESNKSELEKYKQYYLEELRNKNFLLHELNRLFLGIHMSNNSQEESHTELHMKIEQNISASNTGNTRLFHKCSCVEKTHQFENKDGENMVEPSSRPGSTHACVEHYPWMSENYMRELSEGLGDLKKSMQLSLLTEKKQNSDVGELAGIGKPFKMINPEHEIGECGSHGDFETCQFGTNMPVSMLQCSAQSTAKPYSELRESNTTSTINEMETKIRSLNSTLSKLKVRTASKGLELERFKHLYLEELSIRKSFQNYLNKNQQPAIFPLTDIK